MLSLEQKESKSMAVILYFIIGQLIITLANLEGEESFEASFLGQAEEVTQERICDDELILIKGWV